MTRADLVKAMADSTGMSQTDVDKVLGAFLDEVTQVVAKGGEKLTIPGFLTFERAHRNARTGRNPQTGEQVEIPATHVAKVTVWLADTRDFWSFNKIYASYFPGVPPARSTVQSPLMIDAKIEIDCVAYRPL